MLCCRPRHQVPGEDLFVCYCLLLTLFFSRAASAISPAGVSEGSAASGNVPAGLVSSQVSCTVVCFHVLQNVALMLVVLCCRIWLLVSVVSWEFVAVMAVAFCVPLRSPARWPGPGCRQSQWRGSSGPFSDSLRLLLPGLPFLSYSRSLGDSPCRRLS